MPPSIDAGDLAVVSVDGAPLFDRRQQQATLSAADTAVLAHADAHESIAVTDDTHGPDVAATEAITTPGTAYRTLQLTTDGVLEPDAARRAIDPLLEAGWYCAPDL